MLRVLLWKSSLSVPGFFQGFRVYYPDQESVTTSLQQSTEERGCSQLLPSQKVAISLSSSGGDVATGEGPRRSGCDKPADSPAAWQCWVLLCF